MYNIKNKIIYLFLLIIFLLSVNTITSAKYVIDKNMLIANINIDRTKPVIEVIQIKNTNEGYEKYANKTHTITVTIKIIEKNIKDVYLDKQHIDLFVGDKSVIPNNLTVNKIQANENIYELVFNGISENGNLNINIKKGTVIDKAGWENEVVNINTQIVIDNIAPEGIFTEQSIDVGKVNANIKLSEQIRNLDGWQFSEDNLNINKDFTNNISYELPIMDFAGNVSKVNIDITKATYINISYASHNSEVGWTCGYGNYDIAGKKAIQENPIYKTEALAFNISGNVDTDFLQARAFVYTHWGEGITGKCRTSGLLYNYGYNPNHDTYKTMNSEGLVTIEGKKYFQLGGSGINAKQSIGTNGGNPIPDEISRQYHYGISGINLKLKDYSQFSVIYQIFINKVGWISACSDGQDCMYNQKKPMSAFRVALVPKSEKQFVLNTWNKDIGSFNIK